MNIDNNAIQQVISF